MSVPAANAVSSTWEELALDGRLLEAVKRLRWRRPTPVQGAAIPLALKGRDLAIQSRTGSGKTGAFLLPILQRIVTEREQMRGRRAERNPIALILLPSVELCEQTAEVANALAKYIKPRIAVDNLTARGAITKSRLSSAPILISTAALLGRQCRSGLVTSAALQSLRCVVMDEADMMAAMAEQSLRAVQSLLPPALQTVLSSATLTDGLAHIKGQLLHNPVNITLSDAKENETNEMDKTDGGLQLETRVTVRGGPPAEKLQHRYLVATDECHHHTLLYALYRLQHVRGKTLLFVADEEAMYRVYSFLTQLGVVALVYDAQLPMNVRLDALRRFQRGSVSTLVCTDGTMETADRLRANAEDGAGEAEDQSLAQNSAKGRQREAALHRGIDFADVRNVIMFDGVSAATAAAFAQYTHRAGRAGRAGKSGLALSILTLNQAKAVTKPLRGYLASRGDELEPFKEMQRKEAAKLQYRVDNVLTSITRSSTRRQRIAAVAAELTRSTYLNSHMNQRDGTLLQRIISRSRKSTKCDAAILDVPHYMQLSGADKPEEYKKRVNARRQTRHNATVRATKRPRDPLSCVTSAIKSAKKRRI